MRRPAILYISYDGMLEPLGQSQVLAYLERLASQFQIHLISFEKSSHAEGDARDRMARRLEAAGIDWHPLRYHKRPTAPATAWDIAAGIAVGLRLARRQRVAIVHARSYVAGLIGLGIKRASGARLLFDMRGFWADERVDGGLWPADGRLYRGAKRAERMLLRGCDHVVTLTHASTREIARFPYLAERVPPITVIPTCADLDRFSPALEPHAGPITMGYVGSVGTWYLFDDLLECFALLRERRPEARLLIINRDEHDFVRQRLRAADIAEEQTELLSAAHSEMPSLIRRMSLGTALIKPAYSKIASAPTKLAEYLGCGIPCLGNAQVGDVEELLEGGRVGVALTGMSRDEKEAGMERLLALLKDPALSARCVQFARERFSVEQGVADYAGIYRTLLARR
jgi:glycosyltransferase involved in cell wall biosynthesis